MQDLVWSMLGLIKENHCSSYASQGSRYDRLKQAANVLAIKNISKGQELTLDYAHFLDENMESFNCQCGSSICRGMISGKAGNSLNIREQSLNR